MVLDVKSCCKFGYFWRLFVRTFTDAARQIRLINCWLGGRVLLYCSVIYWCYQMVWYSSTIIYIIYLCTDKYTVDIWTYVLTDILLFTMYVSEQNTTILLAQDVQNLLCHHDLLINLTLICRRLWLYGAY